MADEMAVALARREVLESLFARPVEEPTSPSAFLDLFSAASRRHGRSELRPTPETAARLEAVGIEWPVARRLDELDRITLLLRAAERADFESLLEECYRSGDNGERRAVLRALPLLPAPERFVDLAVDACRTSIVPIFEAITCENPYPATHFLESSFNQMALKAVFLGVSVGRILGLQGRLNPELARMAEDYARERRAAGRTIPSDLSRLTARRLA